LKKFGACTQLLSRKGKKLKMDKEMKEKMRTLNERIAALSAEENSKSFSKENRMKLAGAVTASESSHLFAHGK
jgi:hypothetical protein